MAFNTERPCADRRGAYERTVPMQLLCLGMGRSGTDSLCKALTILGIPTYHGFNCTCHWDSLLWTAALNSKYRNKGKVWTTRDWNQLLGDFGAVTDFPAAAFGAELVEAYPEARVILNKRPFDSWHESYLKAIQVPLVENWRLGWLMSLDWESRTIWNMWADMFSIYFHGDWRRNSKQVYTAHNAMVRGLVPPDRFLEWEVTQGWEPLCKFLGKPIPQEPFPSGNSLDELLDRLIKQAFAPRIERGMRKLLLAVIVMVALAGVGIAKFVRPGMSSWLPYFGTRL